MSNKNKQMPESLLFAFPFTTTRKKQMMKWVYLFPLKVQHVLLLDVYVKLYTNILWQDHSIGVEAKQIETATYFLSIIRHTLQERNGVSLMILAQTKRKSPLYYTCIELIQKNLKLNLTCNLIGTTYHYYPGNTTKTKIAAYIISKKNRREPGVSNIFNAATQLSKSYLKAAIATEKSEQRFTQSMIGEKYNSIIYNAMLSERRKLAAIIKKISHDNFALQLPSSETTLPEEAEIFLAMAERFLKFGNG